MKNDIDILKKTYFIINKEGKILIFYNLSSPINNHMIYFPYSRNDLALEFNFVDICSIFENDSVLLKNEIVNLEVMETINNHLIKKSKKMNKQYYVCYKNLTDEEIQTILEFCSKNNLEPDFIPLEDLKKYYQENFEYLSYIRPINKLEKN